jgi:dUTP pyrophosphatase
MTLPAAPLPPDRMDFPEVAMRLLDPRLGREFPLPDYATAGAAGLDLRAMIEAPRVLEPGQSELVPSGLAVHIGDPRWCAVVLPRSGLGHRHGLVLGNLTGLIDADYQGPLLLSLWNRSDRPFTISPGDRVAQLVFVPIGRARLVPVDAFDPSVRGEGGFGHTGTE